LQSERFTHWIILKPFLFSDKKKNVIKEGLGTCMDKFTKREIYLTYSYKVYELSKKKQKTIYIGTHVGGSKFYLVSCLIKFIVGL